MSELSEPEITAKTLEHYGLVAAVCQKLKIAVGKALDAIHKYGQTKLFFEIALGILQEWKLLGKSKRLDSTSSTVCGDYADSDSGIDIIYGYSKDGHPDMKQFMISLATTGKADIPYLEFMVIAKFLL